MKYSSTCAVIITNFALIPPQACLRPCRAGSRNLRRALLSTSEGPFLTTLLSQGCAPSSLYVEKRRLSCESMTPFGVPVVPEVYTRQQHWFTTISAKPAHSCPQTIRAFAFEASDGAEQETNIGFRAAFEETYPDSLTSLSS